MNQLFFYHIIYLKYLNKFIILVSLYFYCCFIENILWKQILFILFTSFILNENINQINVYVLPKHQCFWHIHLIKIYNTISKKGNLDKLHKFCILTYDNINEKDQI